MGGQQALCEGAFTKKYQTFSKKVFVDDLTFHASKGDGSDESPSDEGKEVCTDLQPSDAAPGSLRR